MARISKEKKEEIRKNIIEVSKKYFVEDGYDDTSTSKIAKEVGIAEGTIFNYFKTKSDIFIEVLATDYFDFDGVDYLKYDIKSGVVEILMTHISKVLSKVTLLPKKVLVELSIILLTKGKKQPSMIKKLADLDFKFIDQMTEIIVDLQDKKLILECDAKVMSEIIYSSLMVELLLYLYEKDVTKEMLHKKIEEKVNFVLKNYAP